MKSADRSDLKRKNRETVYHFLRGCDGQSASCAYISRKTGISLPTVIKITSYFECFGLLAPIGTMETSVGRHPTLLRLNPNVTFCLGLSYDGKHLDIASINLNYEIRRSRRLRVQGDPDRVMYTHIPKAVQDFLDEDRAAGAPMAIGLALPVVMDTRRQVTARPAPRIGIAESYSFREACQALSAKYGCPVITENDVNAAAVGEYRTRTLPDSQDLIYITLGSGVGCGLVLDGKLRRGGRYAAGEIAQTLFNGSELSDTPCAESFEARLAPDRLERLFGLRLYDDITAARPDMITLATDYIARHIAWLIGNLAATLDAERFVLGGFLIEPIAKGLLPAVNGYLRRLPLSPLTVECSHTPFISAQGAGSLAIDASVESLFDGE